MPVGTPALATPQIGATAASVTTASFTPTANALLIAFAHFRGSSGAIPTISDSLGETWTPVAAGQDGGFVGGRLFYQVVSASPSARTVTATSAGATQTGIAVIEVTGAGTDLSNYQFDITTGTAQTLNMAAYASTSQVLAGVVDNAGAASSFTGPFTELYDSNLATNLRSSVAYESGATATTTINITTGSSDNYAWALEIKEASAGAISGSASITEAGDTVAGSSLIAIAGTATLSEESDALTASGSVISGIAGTLSATEASDTLAAAATIALRASLAASEGSDSVSGSARVNLAAAASLSEGGDALASAGNLTVQGAASITEEADSLSAAATIVSASRTGTADIAEAGDTLASASGLRLVASASVAEEGDSLSTIAGPLVKGAAVIAEAGDTVTARAVPLLVSSPQERTASVPAEDRTAAVAAEIRTVATKAEVRTAAARAETRRAAA
ncbi:hypothetical protein [Sinorhizobium meliloti]|uniref:hypothetical protein n=1 Tax=Rhizobium meliloti TaxID=382 RepID=UPI000FD1FC4F|nr:hypothetical protein [Sinorhizobium meliloti]RVR12115.1 hypothetical protein CN243_05055 [Sinorhizobium meliloti]